MAQALALIALLVVAFGCDDEADAVNDGATRDAVTDAALPDAALPDALGPDATPLVDAAPDPAPVTVEEAVDLVDPFVGTGGIGFGYAAETPAAMVPNGAVKLGPDTTNGGRHLHQHHFSGYHYDDPDVRGFSHLRLVGTGAGDLGLVRVRPFAARHTPMDKASEVASPGRYAVALPAVGVDVELTAAPRAGVHRYTYAAPGVLVFDAAATIEDSEPAAEVRVDGASVEGEVLHAAGFSARGGAYTVWFSAVVDPPPQGASVEGSEAVLDVSGTVEVRVGVSHVSLERARAHRDGLVGRSFDEVAEAARAAWAEKVGLVRVGGGTEAQRRTFYSAQYHAYAMPTRYDEGGEYLALDREIRAADFPYYTDLSIWDTFRTLHPWLELTDPELERDVLRSLLQMKRDRGHIPRWPAGPSCTSSMLGTPSDFLFAGGALKGIEGVDYGEAFESLYGTATTPMPEGACFGGRSGVADYVALGYVPADRHDEAVSNTVEFGWADHGLSLLAEHLGRPEADELRERAGAWRHLFNPETGFLDPKDAAGRFMAPPIRTTVSGREGPYTEGSGWHWRFSAPHDVAGLANALGGQDALLAELDTFFEMSGVGAGRLNTALPDPYYWGGNQPDLHAAWIYANLGHPERTTHWVRAIQGKLYGPRPDGLPGNDDGGTMSAWYLFASLGLYPLPGSDRYLWATPLFPYAELDLRDHTLTIRAPAGGAPAARVLLDGVPVEGPYLRHADLVAAGELRFEAAP